MVIKAKRKKEHEYNYIINFKIRNMFIATIYIYKIKKWK